MVFLFTNKIGHQNKYSSILIINYLILLQSKILNFMSIWTHSLDFFPLKLPISCIHGFFFNSNSNPFECGTEACGLCVTTIHQARQDTSWLPSALLSSLAIPNSLKLRKFSWNSFHPIPGQTFVSLHLLSPIFKHKIEFIIGVYYFHWRYSAPLLI